MPETLRLPNGTVVQRADDLLLVRLRPEAARDGESPAAALKEAQEFALDEERAEGGPLVRPQVNQTPTQRFIRVGAAETDAPAMRQRLGERTTGVSEVFYSQRGDYTTYFAPLAEVLLIAPAESTQREEVEVLLERFGLSVDHQRSRYLSGKLYVRLEDQERVSYELRDELLASAAIEEVYFEQVPLLKPTCGVPNDPLFPTQWNLERIEWHQDHLGCARVGVIAILDEGCELGHPDLDFASPGLNLGTMLPDGSPTGDHGTACGGIAAAVTGNSEGVAGVAGGAKILPLAVANWSDVEIASGIHYAVEFGADVVSMSFGVYDSWNVWNYALIDPEIVFATNAAVFLCAASGNENLATLNRYPGKHPLVLCVGGSNRDDVRKSVGDASSEPWWGSCHGLESYQGSRVGVDIVAPCLEIPTTDRLGADGYAVGDYYAAFNGTSSATPQVAGLAMLIKGVLPGAGNSLVRKILVETAEKIGPYVYAHEPEHPGSSWTQEVGHGRVNARRALDRARQLSCAPACCCEAESLSVAFSASGREHVSEGSDTHLEGFGDETVNAGGGWSQGVFTAPERGIYYFDWTFVKDSYYHGGTEDDVSIYLQVNETGNFGNAWSGEQAGRRGTGACSIILTLQQGDRVRAMVHSDGDRKRHVAYYGLNGHKLS